MGEEKRPGGCNVTGVEKKGDGHLARPGAAAWPPLLISCKEGLMEAEGRLEVGGERQRGQFQAGKISWTPGKRIPSPPSNTYVTGQLTSPLPLRASVSSYVK